MAKLNIIYFLFLVVLLCSCRQAPLQTIEQKRFDEVLQKSRLSYPKQGTYAFVLWTENSCPNCKKSSASALEAAQSKKMCLIVSPTDGNLLQLSDDPFAYVDTARVFQKYYLGVSNVGFIILKDGHTISIKDYNTNEMEILRKDISSF